MPLSAYHSPYLSEPSDDAVIYDGAPVELQIGARKWEEEKVWAIAKIIDSGLKTLKEN